MWGAFCENKLSSKEDEKRNDGLTKEEGVVMDSLVYAWNNFLKLDTTHPDEINSFADGIHDCQQLLMNRVLRRDYPCGYPSYVKE